MRPRFHAAALWDDTSGVQASARLRQPFRNPSSQGSSHVRNPTAVNSLPGPPPSPPLPLLRAIVGSAQAPGRKLGVALCGLGSLSTNQIAPALLKTRNCRLAGIVTGTPAKAAEWKKKYGLSDKSIYNYKTMAQMATNKDIDIVYVVTPNALHLEHALAAAAAGKHVFCEKPMEISVERCQRMIDAVKKAGKMLGVGYRCQFEPNHLECVRLAREKVLGDVKVIDANFGFAIGDPTQWRLKRDARRRRRAHGRRHLLPADHAHAHRRRPDLDQRHRDQDRRGQVQGSRRNHSAGRRSSRAAWSRTA